ncbi:ABC transporter permease subunit [Streptomyces sp. G1]|uniref:ABC transporter permease subunit n=1 Tax=Streptomyces sp. G1 TaxID=361572 RepID=UPI0035ABF988
MDQDAFTQVDLLGARPQRRRRDRDQRERRPLRPSVHRPAASLDSRRTSLRVRPVVPPGLNGIAASVMTLAAASFGAITVFGEYATGMIRTTFAAVPDRRAVITAKVVLVAAVTLLLGAVVSVASFFTVNAMLASRHVGLSIHDPGCLRAVTAYALVVPACALIGMAFGAVLRHATASIVAVVGMLFILPLLFGGDRYRALKEIGNHLPLAAQGRLALNPDSYTSLGAHPGTVTGSWIALGAWALVSVIVAVTVVRRGDV